MPKNVHILAPRQANEGKGFRGHCIYMHGPDRKFQKKLLEADRIDTKLGKKTYIFLHPILGAGKNPRAFLHEVLPEIASFANSVSALI